MRNFSPGVAVGSLVMLAVMQQCYAAAADADSTGGLAEITVTARKFSEKAQDVPESMTVLTQETLETAGISTVTDMVNLTPNMIFDPNPTPGAFTFTVRGISMAQGGEAPVAIVVDGVEVPDPLFINEELLNIQSVQVLRGPQGSLYGRNALAGAIIIDSQQPGDEVHASVKARYGNGADRYLNGVLSGPIVPGMLYGSVAVSSHKFAGLEENSFLNTEADSLDEKTYLGRVVFKPFDALTVAARVNLVTQSDRVNTIEVVDTQQFEDYDHFYLSENSIPVARQHLLDTSLKVDYDLGFATATSITGYNAARTNLSGDADFTPQPVLLQNVQRNVFARSEELRLASNQSSFIKWVVGGFFQTRGTLNALLIPFDNGSGHPTSDFAIESHDIGTSRSYAGFGQGTARILPNTDLTLGLRYDSDRRTSVDANFEGSATSKTFSATQPKASFEYHWSEDWQSYISAAKGFRSGGFNAYYSVGTPSREYGPQTDKNYEVGFKGTFFDRRLSVDAAAYHTDVDNQQLFFINANPPSQNVTTIDRVKINGGELEIAAQVVTGFQLQMGVGVARSRIDAFSFSPTTVGESVPLSPDYTAHIGGTYTFALTHGWNVVTYANLNRRGPVYWDAANTLSTPPRDLLDLRITLQNEHLFITPYGKNLLSERYPTSASVDAFGDGIHGRTLSEPRMFGVEFGAKL
jgi:iron complex outermembrane recepter protein